MRKDIPLDLKRLKTHTLGDGARHVEVSKFVKPTPAPPGLLEGIPEILAGLRFKDLCRSVARAREKKKEVVLAMGAHPIKCGLSLLVIDLIERGVITALALNGAGAVHDWEVAYGGVTSEDVAESLSDGSFGMCADTAEALNSAADRAARDGEGFGAMLGRDIEESDFPLKSYSLLAAGYRMGIPTTLHVSVGCDIVHMHAGADGASIGAATMADFRKLAGVTARLDKGVWLNVGSAVVLPEVFLKTVAMARNLTGKPKDFVAGDLDMIRHYRPHQNVLTRPGGRGLTVTGHHEILIPLLRWGVLSEMEK